MDKQYYIEQQMNSAFASWVSKTAVLGAVLFLALSVIDYAGAPGNVLLFLPYRFSIALALIVVSVLSRRTDPERVAVHRALAYAAVIGSALTIEIMIMKFGGHRSPYYAGMILLGLCVIGFIPARMPFHLAAAALIYGIYAAPVLIFDTLVDPHSFIISNAFLAASLASMLLMRSMGQKGIMSELELKYDREQQHAGLEENVRDRTAQLSATIADLREVIAERRNTEQALRESEEKFRTLFEESRDVFYISTPEGKFLDINPAGVELFGYPSKEALLSIDITRDLYVNPQERKRFIDLVDRTAYAKDYEVQMKRKNGEPLFVIITSTAVRDEKGRLSAFRGIIRDVTEQKKLQQQLLQSQKMEAVGQLAGGIAHDFNNILTAIMGYASILRKKMQTDDPQRVPVEHVLEAAERGAGLTHSLLAFGRKQVMNSRQVDLNEIVRHGQKLLARLIGENIAMKSVLAPGELIIVADSLQLEQVLMNLATNARDAMPRGGTFAIETAAAARDDRSVQQEPGLKPGDYAVMTVTDTGAGMDEAVRKKIFEPFFTTKDVGKGSGLGLAIVYGIVQQHNGHITVTSEPGTGTSFRIYLPLAPVGSKPQRAVRDEGGPAPCGSETILLGEDDRTVRAITASVLVECGYTVIEAEDGEDAVNKFIEHRDRIDALILDVIMPGKNGREVYDIVKSIKPGIKVLFISGYTADVMHTKEILDEGLHFLQKPVHMDALLRALRSVVET